MDILLYGPSIQETSSTLEIALQKLTDEGFLVHSLSKEILDFNGRFMGLYLLDGIHRRVGTLLPCIFSLMVVFLMRL